MTCEQPVLLGFRQACAIAPDAVAKEGASPGCQVPESVVVHPLVLLSVVDHYNRVAKDTRRRVVGVLLGEWYKGQLDVTNSFAGAAGRPVWSMGVACWSRPGGCPRIYARHLWARKVCCSMIRTLRRQVGARLVMSSPE